MQTHCKRGHEQTPENVNGRGTCKLRRAKDQRKWRDNNPEKSKEMGKNWRVNNPEKQREKCLKCKLENSDKVDEYYICRQFDLKKEEIPEEWMELYKVNLQLKREIKESEKEEKEMETNNVEMSEMQKRDYDEIFCNDDRCLSDKIIYILRYNEHMTRRKIINELCNIPNYNNGNGISGILKRVYEKCTDLFTRCDISKANIETYKPIYCYNWRGPEDMSAEDLVFKFKGNYKNKRNNYKQLSLPISKTQFTTELIGSNKLKSSNVTTIDKINDMIHHIMKKQGKFTTNRIYWVLYSWFGEKTLLSENILAGLFDKYIFDIVHKYKDHFILSMTDDGILEYEFIDSTTI